MNELSKSEIIAEKILKRIHVHDIDSGGVFTEITGSQGSGKTSVMLSFMAYTMKNYPNEKIFWSSCYYAPLQFVKIGKDNFHIMVKQNSGVTFHDRNQRLKQIYPEITYFKDYQDLYDKAKPGTCNAVFFGNRLMWIDFIHFLRSIGEWVHVYIDELSEIAPAFTSGSVWKKIRDFSIDAKEIRKCMLNLHTNTQSVSDIDHRIRSKVMVKIYLPGARTDNVSRITQKAIDNLEEDPINGNEAYIEYSGKFGKTRFKDIYKPTPGMQWEARIDGR
jgi:RecA/RadA recombinase